jgi:hypothetical protein
MTNDKKYDKKLAIELPFAEALERFAQTSPKELIDVKKESMPDATIESLIDAFEACAHTNEEGKEFWFARDLQKLFDYAKWENFDRVVKSGMTACVQSGQDVSAHWLPDLRKSISGKGKEEDVIDYQMSRYACYLTAQNADAKKRPVAFAQTYFAIQTRRQEIADKSAAVAIPMSEDEKRLYLRNQIKEHNRHLSSAAKAAGVVTPQEFAIFHSHGYQGLYGKTVGLIRRYKGIESSADILDRMGSTELAANFFRVTQTEEKLRKENIKGKDRAYRTHFEVGRQVRDAMLKISGIAPEDLPAVDHIKHAAKRLVAPSQVSVSVAPKNPSAAPLAAPQPVDLTRDLWKYALLVMVQRQNMEIATTELIAELPKYIAVPEHADIPNASRGDSKFSQLVRNLKSHKNDSTNFIAQGFAESIPGGFRATQKGRDFILMHFGNRASVVMGN